MPGLQQFVKSHSIASMLSEVFSNGHHYCLDIGIFPLLKISFHTNELYEQCGTRSDRKSLRS